ncbi:C-type polyheme cytochrome OmcB [Geobacter sulfurreducens subsp. ethanolicus]|uniref:C-type polyheme cytochrome OmcB n=1 Tax=Geobacter sulfurreducens TaxID=35554 RepID=UPI0025722785|nr:C-type polyheme cytochrome OmcB [Geobacter sulfurreducens]BEH09266.1 C-type polyheme cytochrome OmcB [Geobacter sulfurreducens subsp. ethanolicus]
MSRKVTKYSAVLAVSLFAAALAGCGSENKEGSIGTGPGGVATVGDTACVQCHSAVTEALTGESLIAQYQKSSPHNTAGLGCESCHGGGAQHNGVGPLPFAQPDANRCADCHDGTTAVATNSNTAFAESRHNIQTIRSGATCRRCHTHEGAVLSNIAGYTGDLATLEDTVNQNKVPLVSSYSQISCATCHEHGGGLRTIKATNGAAGPVVNWDPNNNRTVDQFDLCTSCHNMYSYNGSTLLTNGVPVNGVTTGTVGHHETTWYRIIATTHFDNYSTGPQAGAGAGGTNAKVEGYVLRRTGANPCFDCHGHEAKTNTRPGRDATIHSDWAKSAHAGGLLTAKYNAVGSLTGAAAVNAAMNAYVDDNTAIAWTHYNWDASSRSSCQRCHTATGAANFMSNPATYNPTGNSFSHLQGWNATNGSKQNELLYCWGCHTNAGTGELRNPGAITENYAGVNSTSTGTTGTAVTISYPDIAGSNVCMTCHLGREAGENIKAITDADGILGFVNSHYLAAGGQLFGKTGYEYATRSYAKPTFFAHDKIGTAAAPGTGSNGPCAGCHMTTPNSHSFLPVTKDGTGAITAITSTACATCHAGAYALTPEALTAEEEEYVASLEALKAALAGKGILFFNAHPYFYRDTNANGIGDPGELVSSNAFTNWAGVYGLALWKDVMGAAFNANLLIHDPGGYAHNRFYVKRLIWDSIDFIYDGVLNNDVAAAIDAQVTATRLDSATATAAKAYLGTTRP